jgi:hypothetical protein
LFRYFDIKDGLMMRRVFKRKIALAAFSLVAISLLLNVPVSNAQYTCVPAAGGSTTTSSLTTADPTQTGRIVRDGRPSSCVGKTNALQNATAVHAKAFNFTNPTGQTACVTVNFDHTGCGVNNTTANVAYSTYNPASPATNVIGDSGFSSTGIGSYSFSLAAGASYTIVVHEITPNLGCPTFSFTIAYSTTCRQVGTDRNNDGTADLTVFRPSNAFWYSESPSAANIQQNQFGQAADTILPEDYSGDGSTDLGVFRAATGTWYTSPNPAINYGANQWGTATDTAVPGDFDRDGKADLAVWRPTDGFWYVLRSSTGTLQSTQWGTTGDIAIPADFDGDQIPDFALLRPSDPANNNKPTWYILESNFQNGFFVRSTFGQSGDRLVPADYDGDGKADIALFRPSDGTWWIIQSSVTVGNPQRVVQFGQNGDIPQPADYDGDKKIDIAVYRPSNGTWYWIRSSDGTAAAAQFGAATDTPATTHYPIRAIP